MGNGWIYSPRSGQDGHENESERYGVSDQESLNLGKNYFFGGIGKKVPNVVYYK
jgi:hypothetical protein